MGERRDGIPQALAMKLAQDFDNLKGRLVIDAISHSGYIAVQHLIEVIDAEGNVQLIPHTDEIIPTEK